ncbi:hypothetical protein CR513_01776, partial [Mucuna pruriens]
MHPKKKNDKKESEKDKEVLITSKRVMRKMLESFQDIFPKDIPRGLPPIKGIEYQIRFQLAKSSYIHN